jgi:hypothetical protein
MAGFGLDGLAEGKLERWSAACSCCSYSSQSYCHHMSFFFSDSTTTMILLLFTAKTATDYNYAFHSFMLSVERRGREVNSSQFGGFCICWIRAGTLLTLLSFAEFQKLL